MKRNKIIWQWHDVSLVSSFGWSIIESLCELAIKSGWSISISWCSIWCSTWFASSQYFDRQNFVFGDIIRNASAISLPNIVFLLSLTRKLFASLAILFATSFSISFRTDTDSRLRLICGLVKRLLRRINVLNINRWFWFRLLFITFLFNFLDKFPSLCDDFVFDSIAVILFCFCLSLLRSKLIKWLTRSTANNEIQKRFDWAFYAAVTAFNWNVMLMFS